MIPALNAWAARANYMTAGPIATQGPEYGDIAIDDITTEGGFGLQVTWAIDVLGLFSLTLCPWVFVLPGTGRCPVDWCRNGISVLQLKDVTCA